MLMNRIGEPKISFIFAAPSACGSFSGFFPDTRAHAAYPNITRQLSLSLSLSRVVPPMSKITAARGRSLCRRYYLRVAFKSESRGNFSCRNREDILRCECAIKILAKAAGIPPRSVFCQERYETRCFREYHREYHRVIDARRARTKTYGMESLARGRTF